MSGQTWNSGERRAPIAPDLDLLHSAAPAAASAIVGDEPVDQRLARGLLQPWIERGAHGETAAVKLVLAEAVENLAADFLGEILRSEDLGPALALDDAKRLSLGGFALFLGGEAVLDDMVDDPVAASYGAVREFERVVIARRLGQGRKIGAIGKGQFVESLVPIGLGGGGHAIGADAEIDLVEIELEDLLLGEGALDADGKDRFLQLALDGLIAGQEKILGDLLGNCRGADRAPARRRVAQIGDDGADDALHVEAAMLVEVLVLGGDESVDDAGRDRGDRHVDAPLARELGDQRAVIGVDAGHHGRLVFRQDFVVRQLARHLPQDEGGGTGRGDEHDHGRGEHETDETQEEPATAAPPALRRLDWLSNVHRRTRPDPVLMPGNPQQP